MDITGTILQPTVQPLDTNQTVADPELVDATRQFEAVLLRQFLGDALKPILHATPGANGPGAGVYQYMMTDVIANALTEQEQFGIASLLQIQLSGQGSRESHAEENGTDAVNIRGME